MKMSSVLLSCGSGQAVTDDPDDEEEEDPFYQEFEAFLSSTNSIQPQQTSTEATSTATEDFPETNPISSTAAVAVGTDNILANIDQCLDEEEDEDTSTQTNQVDNASKDQEDSQTMEEDDDSHLLDSYDENSDSEDDTAIDMDNFAKTLDSSILYTTAEEDLEAAVTKSRNESGNNSSKSEGSKSECQKTETSNSGKTDKSKVSVKSEVPKPETKSSADVSNMFREKAHLIKQRYYERALRKWKNTTNFADGYMIPALKDVKAPRLWQDGKTKKYFGGEDPQEWSDNNHPMWEEWRRAVDRLPTFVHDKWGPDNLIDVSRNLSKFAKLKLDSNSSQGSEGELKQSEARKDNESKAERGNDTNMGVLIDEREVLSVLLEQVEGDKGSDSEDDDEKDNIYSKLEVRVTQDETKTEDERINLTGREPCGFCERVCFCSPGVRLKRPYFHTKSNKIDQSVSGLKRSLKESDFREEALGCMAVLCTEKLEGHTDKFSIKVIKENQSVRTQQLMASINETYDLAEDFGKASAKRREAAKPFWSEEQAREMLSVETMQDLFQANYSSPYEHEDRQACIEACSERSNKKKHSSTLSFHSKSFLENY